jgi:hypothetical protein
LSDNCLVPITLSGAGTSLLAGIYRVSEDLVTSLVTKVEFWVALGRHNCEINILPRRAVLPYVCPTGRSGEVSSLTFSIFIFPLSEGVSNQML